MNLHNIELMEFLNKINSSKPIPSAGAALAVTAALGAALLGLTAKVSQRKEGSTKANYLEELSNRVDKLAVEFIKLGEEDVTIYLKAAKLGADPSRAIEIPLDMAEKALELALQYEKVINQCYTPIKGDAWLGVELLKTCAKTANYIALLNIHQLKPEEQTDYQQRIDRIQQQLGVKCTPEGCTLG